jgi:adenylate kinase family enzyme
MKNKISENHSLILLRGLPGSGKSTLAETLSENGKHPVLSVDDYFTNETGDYHFEFEKNHLAYAECISRTENFMKEKCEKIFILASTPCRTLRSICPTLLGETLRGDCGSFC